MDRFDLDVKEHVQALDGLARLNRASGSARILWRPIRDLARASGKSTLRVFDVASGSGDGLIRLWRRAAAGGLRLEIQGGNRSPTAVAHARHCSQQAGVPITFCTLDALNDRLPLDFDVVTASLFLHHLSDHDAVELLRRMARAARSMVLINDLRRCIHGYLLAWAATRLLTRSAVVRVDALRSVAAAFTLAEAKNLAKEAGLHDAEVERRWPCRYLLKWVRTR